MLERSSYRGCYEYFGHLNDVRSLQENSQPPVSVNPPKTFIIIDMDFSSSTFDLKRRLQTRRIWTEGLEISTSQESA